MKVANAAEKLERSESDFLDWVLNCERSGRRHFENYVKNSE